MFNVKKIYYLLFILIFLKNNTIEFENIVPQVQQGIDIANDIKSIFFTKDPRNFDIELSDRELLYQKKNNLERYITMYGTIEAIEKNSIEDFKYLYDKIKPIIKEHVPNFKETKSYFNNEASLILEKTKLALNEVKKIINKFENKDLLLQFQTKIDFFISQFKNQQENLMNLTKDLIELEQKAQGISKLQIPLFQEIITPNNDILYSYNAYNAILDSKGFIQNKDSLYKKKIEEIKELSADSKILEQKIGNTSKQKDTLLNNNNSLGREIDLLKDAGPSQMKKNKSEWKNPLGVGKYESNKKLKNLFAINKYIVFGK